MVTYSYTSSGGSDVTVPLTVAEAEQVTKASFHTQILNPSRQRRALLHLHYDLHKHCADKSRTRWTSKDGKGYTVNFADPFLLAIVGDTRRLVKLCKGDTGIAQRKDPNGEGATLLYYACRAGFRDLVDALLALGSPVNEIGPCGSTPLHAASYYGHAIIVSGLLAQGADRSIKNRYGRTAQMDARTTEVQMMFHDDVIKLHLQRLVDVGVGESLRQVVLPGKDRTIAWKVSRPAALVQRDLVTGTAPPSDWLTAWHGTKPQHLESILRMGLRPAGSNGVEPPADHIPLGRAAFGIENFAAAVFVSPDIVYSAHPAYAGRLSAGGEEWVTLVLARVRPGSFRTFRSTVQGYIPVGDGFGPEQRVAKVLPNHFRPEVLEGHPSLAGTDMFRVSSSGNLRTDVVVTDAILLSKSFLEADTLPRQQAADILVSA